MAGSHEKFLAHVIEGSLLLSLMDTTVLLNAADRRDQTQPDSHLEDVPFSLPGNFSTSASSEVALPMLAPYSLTPLVTVLPALARPTSIKVSDQVYGGQVQVLDFA